MKRRVLVILLALAMLITYIPVVAYADTEAAGDVIAEDQQLTDETAEAVEEPAEQTEPAEDVEDPPAEVADPAVDEDPAEEPVEEPAEEPSEEPIEEPEAIESPEKPVGPIDIQPINGGKTAGINSGELKGPPQNGWYKEDGKWYYYQDGSKFTGPWFLEIGDYCYWFDKNGVLQTGWIKEIDGSDVYWHYANSKGELQLGWVKIGDYWYYFQGDYFDMTVGGEEIDGKCYYFSEKGVMQTGWIKYVVTWTEDGEEYTETYWCYANSSGVLQDGWQKIDGKWYYFEPDDFWMYTGRMTVDGKPYYFSDKGVMQTGWIKRVWDDGYVDWYYANSSGVLQDGWQTIGGKKYYFEPEGYWMYTGICEIDGKDYFFGTDGALGTGWSKYVYTYEDSQLGPKTKGTDWYYTDSKGVVQYGWKKIDGKWYYFDSDYGYMYYGDYYEIDGADYFFADNGVMQTGWIKKTWSDGYNWYYANSSGVLQSGWQTIGGKKYYFNENYHYSLIGYWILDGQGYYFDSNGALVSKPNGWLKEYDDWYYFENGEPVKGWKKISGKWYYFENLTYPYMVTGLYYIDGKYYFFDENGVMRSNPKGWQQDKIRGYWYYFENGSLVIGWKKISGKWYYFDEAMFIGYCYVSEDDKYYFFNSSGAYEANPSGWKNTGYAWMYFVGGEPVYGWKKISGKYYYFNDYGEMTYGWQKIDGKWYYLGTDGVMVTGKQTIDGVTYNFTKSGAWDGK